MRPRRTNQPPRVSERPKRRIKIACVRLTATQHNPAQEQTMSANKKSDACGAATCMEFLRFFVQSDLVHHNVLRAISYLCVYAPKVLTYDSEHQHLHTA